MDEVDRVFIHDNHRDDFFALIRYWHDGRARDPQLALLNLVLAYRTETSLFIQNLSQSPFTVGQVFELADFTKPQFEYLNFKHGSPVKKAAENDTLMRLLGGHQKISETFLTDAKHQSDFNLQLVSDRVAGRTDGTLGSDTQKMLAMYREILRGARVPDEALDPVQTALKLSGLVVPGPAGLCVQNRIYETVFDATWVRSILGDAEPERPDDEKPTYDVFVSYSWEDRDWVVGYLAPRLQDAGLRIAIDLDLLPGSNWAEELRRMRESSEFFLPVLSPAWATSRGAQEEFELMSNRVGKIVPVLLRPTHLPPFLAGLYYADFTEPLRMESAMERLIRALGGRKEQPQKPASQA